MGSVRIWLWKLHPVHANGPEAYRALKSSPVRFFLPFLERPDPDRFPKEEIAKRPDLNRKKPQKTAKDRSELVYIATAKKPVQTGYNQLHMANNTSPESRP
jgi:hypothetical protein